MHREELEKEDAHDVDRRLEKGFARWFKTHVSDTHLQKYHFLVMKFQIGNNMCIFLVYIYIYISDLEAEERKSRGGQ